MDIILNLFFQNFAQLERDTLHARYKRRSMVEYLSTVIEGCSRGEECDPQDVCRYAVVSIIRYHQISLNKNGSVCKMGKYHNILYVAIKLCYTWQLDDFQTICVLLDNIYSCEKSFDRIWMGALFGTNASYVIGGWKSDFCNKEENLKAVMYYLNHANSGRKRYENDEKNMIRFIDIPLETCGRTTPLKIALQLQAYDLFQTLLRFGAQVDEFVLRSLLSSLSDSERCYNHDIISCFNFFLRSVPFLNVKDYDDYFLVYDSEKNKIINKLLYLVEDGILSKKKCRLEPPDLKHFCRCSIRKALWQNYQLPNGIGKLDLPRSLEKYLDLSFD